MEKDQDVLLTHGDSITQTGDRLKTIALSSSQVIAAIANTDLRIYGVQFHPEVDITTNGQQMLSNFLVDIAGVEPNFTMECRQESCIKYIQESVGSSKVLVLVSGGVDSSVCAALLRKALPADQIFAVHIDNGVYSMPFMYFNYKYNFQ